jgi:hypothetical protein
MMLCTICQLYHGDIKLLLMGWWWTLLCTLSKSIVATMFDILNWNRLIPNYINTNPFLGEEGTSDVKYKKKCFLSGEKNLLLHSRPFPYMAFVNFEEKEKKLVVDSEMTTLFCILSSVVFFVFLLDFRTVPTVWYFLFSC